MPMPNQPEYLLEARLVQTDAVALRVANEISTWTPADQRGRFPTMQGPDLGRCGRQEEKEDKEKKGKEKTGGDDMRRCL